MQPLLKQREGLLSFDLEEHLEFNNVSAYTWQCRYIPSLNDACRGRASLMCSRRRVLLIELASKAERIGPYG